MAPSIPFTDVVSFGRQLINELSLEPGVDTLSRWMAHYVAEIIIKAEQAQGEEKALAEKECFEVILKLWKHRAYYEHKRPLKSFVPIFEMLRILHEPKSHWYYQEPKGLSEDNNTAWLKIAHGIDHSARDIIRWCLAMVVNEAAEEEERWLDSKIPELFEDNDDQQAAELLIEDARLFITDPNTLHEADRKKLNGITERLDALLELSKQIRNNIVESLANPTSDKQ